VFCIVICQKCRDLLLWNILYIAEMLISSVSNIATTYTELFCWYMESVAFWVLMLVYALSVVVRTFT